jgi:hypothetical protein
MSATPAARPGALQSELEVKFMLPHSASLSVLQWLRAHAVPHPAFHDTVISSVYYDTADWRLLRNKVDSDFFKRKIRLRWYGGAPGILAGSAYIEEKAKEGGRRTKVRVPLEATGETCEASPLDCPLYDHALAELRARGLAVEGLRPAYQITYRRFRFLHPFCAAVICLDTEIHVPRTNPRWLAPPRVSRLADAVLEQKGPRAELEPALHGLLRYGLRRTAFSKYLRTYEHLFDASI